MSETRVPDLSAELILALRRCAQKGFTTLIFSFCASQDCSGVRNPLQVSSTKFSCKFTHRILILSCAYRFEGSEVLALFHALISLIRSLLYESYNGQFSPLLRRLVLLFKMASVSHTAAEQARERESNRLREKHDPILTKPLIEE